MNDASKCINWIETSLKIPEGPLAAKALKLAPFQKKFIRGALAKDTNIACLSIGRGNAKTALSSAIALGSFLGVWDDQPNRDVVICARTRDQGSIAFQFCIGFLRTLPDDVQKTVKIRRMPRLELEIETPVGRHILRVISADGKTALGSAPTMILMDERGHWEHDKGDDLEAALLSGLGKRAGRALIISTSAADDGHAFSVWMDTETAGVYRQEHRPAENLPADDLDSLKEANPGASHGIGPSLEWLQQEAQRCIVRGGSTLTKFRLFNRNERVADEKREVLIAVDEWQKCEVSELPPKLGGCVVGIDLGGSASMSAVAYYWPASGRLETYGTFPSEPSLAIRGANDGVKDRYQQMHTRGELGVMGGRTVPVSGWINHIMVMLDGKPAASLVADRFKQAEVAEAMEAAQVRCPVIWRGFGYKDGSEDVERFRRAVYEQKVSASESLLLRSALREVVVLVDPAANSKLAKGRSKARVDAASAAVIAVAQGQRMMGASLRKGGRVLWV